MPLLEPVLVCGLWGRVGSTLCMQLLGTSDAVSFDRSYPFENRSLASLLSYLAPLGGAQSAPKGWWMDDPDHLWWVDPESFGFEVTGAPLGYAALGVDRADLHRRSVRAVWQAYSDAVAQADRPPARFYAEKFGGRREDLDGAGIPYRVLNLVRDPRDVWASVLAFDVKRGYYGFGRRREQQEGSYLESFVEAVRRRLDEMAHVVPGVPTTTVRYEDLVADLPAEAARIGGWLDVRLDAHVVEAGREAHRHHMTSDSTVDSVGRWRRDLPAAHVETIEDRLGGHIHRLGYEQAGADRTDRP